MGRNIKCGDFMKEIRDRKILYSRKNDGVKIENFCKTRKYRGGKYFYGKLSIRVEKHVLNDCWQVYIRGNFKLLSEIWNTEHGIKAKQLNTNTLKLRTGIYC